MNLDLLLLLLSVLQLRSVVWATSTQSCSSKGVCALGKDGDRCTANAQCKNVCSRYGICETPKPGTGNANDPCTSPSQCKSGWCGLFHGVSRPNYDGPDDTSYSGVALSDDTTCQVSYIGESCNESRQCYAGRCENHVCSRLPLNSTCDQDYACETASCIDGVCVIQAADKLCHKDSNCFSKNCVSMECRMNDYTCYPPNLRCAAVPPGGTCRSSEDCDVGDEHGYEGSSICDETDHKCRQTLNQKCKVDADCLSKHCTDGKCSTKASVKTTTKTTKMATPTKTPTRTPTKTSTKTPTRTPTKTSTKTSTTMSAKTSTKTKATSATSTSKLPTSTSKTKSASTRTKISP